MLWKSGSASPDECVQRVATYKGEVCLFTNPTLVRMTSIPTTSITIIITIIVTTIITNVVLLDHLCEFVISDSDF